MDNTLTNQIRNKVDIVDIIGERIPLTAKGKNFFGVCPFHDDTNPSMSVSREKQIYTCFSCHATGNVFTFLMNYEHMEFKDVLKYLDEEIKVVTNETEIIEDIGNGYVRVYLSKETNIEKLSNDFLNSMIEDTYTETNIRVFYRKLNILIKLINQEDNMH